MTQLNKYSSKITQPASQGASQAMLYATGMSAEDMNKAQVGISSVWYEGNPCNMHLGDLAARVREGVQAAGLVGMRFNTIGVSDGISMGTDGMSYSLQSRDLIADSIETVMSAQWYDANISLPGSTVVRSARVAAPKVTNWTSCPPSSPMANTSAAAFQKTNAQVSSGKAAPGPGPVAECTLPTPWLRLLKPWG